IRKTLAHIVRADEGYLNTYDLIPPPFLEPTDRTPLDEIASRLARVREAVEKLFASRELEFDRRVRIERRKSDLELWVPLVQFAPILSLNGLAAPDLDVWTYATVEGAIVRDPE